MRGFMPIAKNRTIRQNLIFPAVKAVLSKNARSTRRSIPAQLYVSVENARHEGKSSRSGHCRKYYRDEMAKSECCARMLRK